jgi:hypothetical protein
VGGVKMPIDFDNFRERKEELKECFAILPKPFFVRISGGKKGLHIILGKGQDERQYRLKYDDPERLIIDAIRRKFGFTSNMLLSKKCIGHEVKIAGDWIKINNDSDVKKFLEEL